MDGLTPGGLINVVTKRPQAESHHSLQQQFGSYDLYRTTLDSTGSLNSDDSLLYRLNFEYLDKNSFRDFVSTERVVVAPSLTWKVSDKTQIDLDLMYTDEDGIADNGIIAIGKRPANIPTTRFLGEPADSDQNIEYYQTGLTIRHEITASAPLPTL